MAARRGIKTTAQSSKEVPLALTNQSSTVDKIKKPEVFVPLIIILVAALLFYFKGLFIVAIVNGQPITRLSLISELEKQGGKQALSAIINQNLILQEARKKNVEVGQKETDDSIKQIEDSLKSQGQSLDAALAVQGMTRQDLLMQLKLKILVEKLLADKIKVTDKEIADYLEKNKDTLPTNLKEDEIKKGVRQQLEQQQLASKSQEWIAELNKNAKINYFVGY